ncbi:hypothetical protein JNW90_26570 [Micromonospora sp. STR1s_5]|nr:hypothetical protein [Micromonospora sp. STR1s_5]
MTFIDMYIGKLSDREDPLDHGGVPPPPLSDHFPPDPTGSRFGSVKNHWMSERQTDWGSWAGIVSKAQILAFMRDIYGTEPLPSAYWHERLLALRRLTETLSDTEAYALVLIES